MKQRIYVKRPIEIAITGKIGTGKTTICNLLKNLGYQIFESDNEVKKLFYRKKVKTQISSLFSNKVKTLFKENGSVNKKTLGDFLFSNTKELKKLEQILYPLLEIQKKKFKKKYSSEKIIFFDIPLLFEKKMHKEFDLVILLKVNKDIQKERVLKRKGMSRNKLEKILLSQEYDLNFFKKYISLEIDTSKGKDLILKKLKDFTNTL